MDPGYNVSTTFDVTVADGAPTGVYNVKLELIDLDDLDPRRFSPRIPARSR